MLSIVRQALFLVGTGSSTSWFRPTQEDTMTKHCTIHVIATTTLLLTMASVPTYASGLLGGLGNTLGGITNDTGNTVTAVTNTIGTIPSSLGSGSVLSSGARLSIIGGINAQLNVLSPKQLAKLCLSVGGGAPSCNSANHAQMLKLINTRIKLLGPKQLVSLCISVRAGCGTANGGGSNGLGGDGGGSNVANSSKGEEAIYKKNCGSILHQATTFSAEIVKFCRIYQKRMN